MGQKIYKKRRKCWVIIGKFLFQKKGENFLFIHENNCGGGVEKKNEKVSFRKKLFLQSSFFSKSKDIKREARGH